jgi:outer membrane protein TolC
MKRALLLAPLLILSSCEKKVEPPASSTTSVYEIQKEAKMARARLIAAENAIENAKFHLNLGGNRASVEESKIDLANAISEEKLYREKLRKAEDALREAIPDENEFRIALSKTQ